MKLEVIGPLLAWTAMFVIGSAIKYVAFSAHLVWLEAAPEAALWATGIFFTLSASAGNFLERRAIPRMQPDPDGSGFRVTYDVTLPDDLKPSQKFLYLFLVTMMVWIVDILLVGSALQAHQAAEQFDTESIFCIGLAFLLTSIVVVIALRSVREVIL